MVLRQLVCAFFRSFFEMDPAVVLLRPGYAAEQRKLVGLEQYFFSGRGENATGNLCSI
jgi:hypothetical protein